MNNKSKIIVLASFVIIIIGVIIINNIDSNSIIENLENKKNEENKNNEINVPISNCISGCVISFDDCTYLNNGISKCKWSNLYKFNITNYDETYQQYCDACSVISDISYDNVSPDSNKNSYHFKYKNKKIILKNGEYMDQDGNIKKIPKEKHLPPLNKNNNLSNSELDNLEDNQDEANQHENNNKNINNVSNKISNDDIIAALSSHIKTTFGNYLNSIVSNHMNNRNIGSNLTTSPHTNIQYTNLDSSLTNLAQANSNNRIINDNPFIQNGSCINSQGQQISCPEPYDYRPPLSS